MINCHHACGVTRENSPSNRPVQIFLYLVSGMDRRHTPWRWTRTKADLEKDCGVGVERLVVDHTLLVKKTLMIDLTDVGFGAKDSFIGVGAADVY